MRKKEEKIDQHEELKNSINALIEEKHISRDTLFDAIEQALVTACKNNFGRTDNVKVMVNRDDYQYEIYAEKTIVPTKDDVQDPQYQIALSDAVEQHIDGKVGDVVKVDFNSQSFGRIATQIAKNVILQKIREEERNAVYNYYVDKQKQVMTGTVQRESGRNWYVNLGKADGFLSEKEMVPGEELHTGDRIKVYVLEVRKSQKGSARILVSRTHKDLVRRLFEEEVAELRDGTVEIKSIAREPGSRTKIAVYSNNPQVDPVGACVGLNGSRVNNIVDELHGEKIDIICWDENPGNFIQNALSPAKITAVFADPEEKSAKVVVPDYQLSLAIGKEGQNARLAARLTGYKIDIKSETQAKDAPGFRYEDYLDVEDEGDEGEEAIEYVDENGNPVEVDENGNPVGGGDVEYVDENGNPVDKDGNPLSEEEIEYVDENGNPVDKDGNPLPSSEDEDSAQAEGTAEEASADTADSEDGSQADAGDPETPSDEAADGEGESSQEQ